MNGSISLDAYWTAATHKLMVTWALEQKHYNTRLAYPNAITGLISAIDSVALLESFELGDIGNVDGNPITQNITLQLSGAITPSFAP